MVIGKHDNADLKNLDGSLFQTFWGTNTFDFQLFEKYPWHRLRRRPPGAAAPGTITCFLFSKYLEKRPIHMFLNDTFHFFQITIIYRGTQVTTQEAQGTAGWQPKKGLAKESATP